MMQELIQSLINTMRQEIGGIHTAFPGTIISFDPTTSLATVQPMVKFPIPKGGSMDYPHISGVPVIFPQSSDAVVAFPVKAGDGCLVVVSERSIDYWMYGRETNTNLSFDLTNAICIPGLFMKPNSAISEACQKNAVVVKCGNSSLSVSSGGISITGDLTVSGTITADNIIDRNE